VRLDPEVLLASLPRSIHAFAAQRLASSRFETDAAAKTDFLENIHKLRATSGRREDATAVAELQRSSGALGFDAETAILRDIENRAKKKRHLDDS